MKSAASFFSFLAVFPAFAAAQTAAPAVETPPAPEKPVVTLTEAQVNSVMTQLKELERQIADLRGSNLGTILQRLRDATASDQAAEKLWMECDALVNSTRKEESKSETRKREEAVQRALENNKKGGSKANEDGDFGMAVRFQIRYLILTLEAHEAKEEEFDKMVPKLQSFMTDLLAAAPKFKGRALNTINQPLGGGGGGGGRRGGGGNPIIEAFQLDRYLNVDNWTNRPNDFGGIYTKTIFPIAEKNDKASLSGLWDARINAEGTFRKETMFAPEYELWLKNDLPELRWERAAYLYEHGSDPVVAMSEMLKVIKDNTAHPNAPAWLKELRTLVQQAAPVSESLSLTKPAGS